MRKLILISACLAAAFGLLGCEQHPNARYTIWYQGAPVEFASPYDSPFMYIGPGGND